MKMVKTRKNSDPGDDAAARQAAEVAVELTEASDLGDGPDPPAGADDAATAATARGRRRGIRRVGGVIGAARTGMTRQSSTMVQRTGEVAGRGGRVASRRTQAAAGAAGRAATRGMSSGITWLTGQVVAMGPRLRIRDQARLRGQFPGRTDEEIAELLIERAGRASGAVGGATGAWAALPVLPAFPAEVAAETLAVIGIEIKLVAELHEILGLPAQGSGTERARAYLAAWAHRRGVFTVPGGFILAAGSPLARMLRRRLVGRMRRSAFALAPLLTGAVAGALINRSETRKLGREILADLRRHRRGGTAG
ncbi:MAG TPA: hypothetical protein VI365_02115 [Trebonia sp.]